MGFGSNPFGQSIPAGLSGLAAMQKTLNETKDRIVKRAAKAGINDGLSPLVAAMKSAVNAAPVSNELKRDARKLLAKRLKKARGETIGKAGFAVGKASKAKADRAMKRSMDKSRPGIGVSASNVHWFVLGTQKRKTKKGRSTGRVPELLKGVTTMAAGTAGSAMVEAARRKIEQVLAREVAKQAKKGASR